MREEFKTEQITERKQTNARKRPLKQNDHSKKTNARRFTWKNDHQQNRTIQEVFTRRKPAIASVVTDGARQLPQHPVAAASRIHWRAKLASRGLLPGYGSSLCFTQHRSFPSSTAATPAKSHLSLSLLFLCPSRARGTASEIVLRVKPQASASLSSCRLLVCRWGDNDSRAAAGEAIW